VGSAYTAVKDPARTRFVYRDRLWQGADLAGLGVASFGHINGVHMQNLDQWEPYRAAVRRGEIPLGRAYRPTDEERMIRELVLQLKRGEVRPAYFAGKYGVDVLSRFGEQVAALVAEGYVDEASADRVALSRLGLLRADVLLRRFFLPQHSGIRYT
jgi:oxygen-independent coproporphyrinogen-3 oxidase